jgi:Domain of unknown function (DUF4915)
MSLPEGVVVIATICNTIGDASPYALWLSDGKRQRVLDLSDHIRDSSGLTGIAYHCNRIYVAVQASFSRILVLDLALNVIDVIANDNFNDLHSLHIVGDALLAVSPGNGKLLKRDLTTGSVTVLANFDPEAWVSVVHYTPDEILLCGHHLRFLDPEAKGGGIFSVGQGRMVLDGLVRPHSLMRYHEGFVVLDSGNARVVYGGRDGIKRTCQLDGFLRGAAIVGEDTLLVAGGPHRTISRKNPAGVASRTLRDVAQERVKIFEVKQGEHTRTYLPELPGFEIYDLLVLPADVVLAPSDDRVVDIEQGAFARYYYVTLLDALLRLSNTSRPAVG